MTDGEATQLVELAACPDHRRVSARRPHVLGRRYTLTFPATGSVYGLSSSETQELIDNYPVLPGSSSARVYLRADDGQACQIHPATIGGGPAFEYRED